MATICHPRKTAIGANPDCALGKTTEGDPGDSQGQIDEEQRASTQTEPLKAGQPRDERKADRGGASLSPDSDCSCAISPDSNCFWATLILLILHHGQHGVKLRVVVFCAIQTVGEENDGWPRSSGGKAGGHGGVISRSWSP